MEIYQFPKMEQSEYELEVQSAITEDVHVGVEELSPMIHVIADAVDDQYDVAVGGANLKNREELTPTPLRSSLVLLFSKRRCEHEVVVMSAPEGIEPTWTSRRRLRSRSLKNALLIQLTRLHEISRRISKNITEGDSKVW